MSCHSKVQVGIVTRMLMVAEEKKKLSVFQKAGPGINHLLIILLLQLGGVLCEDSDIVIDIGVDIGVGVGIGIDIFIDI